MNSTIAAQADIRFLEYRLGVINQWPPSELKQATVEAISRRLASIAEFRLGTENDDLMALSCHLLDGVFSQPVS